MMSTPENPDLKLRPLSADDADWVERLTIAEWSAAIVVAHGTVYRPAELPGFAADIGGEAAGVITYHVEGAACEIVTLNAWKEGLGVGTALIDAVKAAAGRAGCGRLWLITTNDNTSALRFYQKRGFRLSAVHLDAIAESRRLKPEIPFTGLDGIPIRDEIELEMDLSN